MRKGPLFKTLRVIVVIALSIGIAGVLLKMRPRAERVALTDTGRLVEAFPAEAKSLPMVIETYGTVQPREDLDLTAEVRGRIVAIHPMFEDGSFVKSGDLLAKIDPRTYRLEVERQQVQIVQIQAEKARIKQEIRNLEASIRISKSDLSLTKAEFARLQELSKRKVTAQTTLDKAEQRYLASLDQMQRLDNQLSLTGPTMAQLEAKEKMIGVMLRQAELNLERTEIVAPFDGWVVDKVVETGRHVSVGQYMGRIYRHGAFDIEVRIPVGDLKWFPDRLDPERGPDAEIEFGSGDVVKRWHGRVVRTKAGMDEKTRTLPLVVAVDNVATSTSVQDVFQLRPGMFVTVKLKGRRIDGLFELPRHVVHAGGVVFIAQKDRLKIKPVRILRRFKDTVYVDQGIEAGALIIKTPISGAIDGMKIRVSQ